MTPVLLVVVVFVAFLVGTTLGFGSAIVAVSLGAFLIPIPELLAAFVPVNLLVSAYIVLRDWREVDWKLLGRILPLMALGMPIGILLLGGGDNTVLVRGFGLFVVLLSGLELDRLRRSDAPATRPLGTLAKVALLVSGGVAHGAFATGGPMVVYVAGRELGEKRVFRSTLSTLWLVLGIVLTVTYALSGAIDATSLRRTAIFVAPLVLGIAAGDYLHHHVDTRLFRILVFLFLGTAGVMLFATS